jgi:ligand-binding sensor domain-containing protein
VYTLAQADDGTVFAGTSHGIFRWDGSKWQRDGQLVTVTEKPVRVRISSRRTGKLASAESKPAPTASTASAKSSTSPESAEPATASAASGWAPVYKPVGKGPAKAKARAAAKSASKSTAKSAAKSTLKSTPRAPAYEIVQHETITRGGEIDSRVNQLSLSGDAWYAATADGLYRSGDQGQSWVGPVENSAGALFVNAHGETVVAASRTGMLVSIDAGKTWRPVALPEKLAGIQALVVAANQSVWVGGGQGLFYSEDQGQSWKPIEHLPLGEISGLTYDADLKRVLVTSGSSTMIFGVDGTDARWKWWDAGWKVHEVYSKNGRLVGASLYDGIVVEPQPTPGTPAGAN